MTPPTFGLYLSMAFTVIVAVGVTVWPNRPPDPIAPARAYLDAAATDLTQPGYREALAQAACSENPMLEGLDLTQVRCEFVAPCGTNQTGYVSIRVERGVPTSFDGGSPGDYLDAICEGL